MATVAPVSSAPVELNHAHRLNLAEVARLLETDLEQGLSLLQAKERYARYGPNQLAEAPPTRWWVRITDQFNQWVIWVLLAAALLSGLVHEWTDTLVILAIVLLNGLLGFFQEARAGQALAALRKLSAPHARVLRGGQLQMIAAAELVPGDRLEIEAGDYVLADVRLVQSTSLRIDESALTGESIAVQKDAQRFPDSAASLAERHNMGWMGTIVSSGKASAVVIATGMNTELGRIAGLLQQEKAGTTPLQRRLMELGRLLAVACVGVGLLVFLLHLGHHRPIADALLVAVSLAVAAVPEGLPAIVTIALALGLGRMARRRALVRRLSAVEALGSVTVICSDKTGTLTRNQMTVRELALGEYFYQVRGAGYAPTGTFHRRLICNADETGPPPIDPRKDTDLMSALSIAAWASDAEITQSDEPAGWKVVGDPTEAALIVAARKARIVVKDRAACIRQEIPFDSDRKRMSVLLSPPPERLIAPGGADAVSALLTKGAAEEIIGRCVAELRGGIETPLTEQRIDQILWQNSELATRALRVLGLAYRVFPGEVPDDAREENLVFAGLVGMIDPPREEARASVARCLGAGIRPVMITGDHPRTASAIAREIGILHAEDQVISGRELEKVDGAALDDMASRAAVFARVTAEHKLRIVRALRGRGEVVAMTGDGVNDAPAVRAADIGIAMGQAGTDVTREASDVVLTDDNFATIVTAVEEGRGIFDGIGKFVHYLLSCNTGEVAFVLFASLVGWDGALTPIQILWINLVTDGLPALGLGIEPPEPDTMLRPPRPPQMPLITWRRGGMMLLSGLLIAAATTIGFTIAYQSNPARLPLARTVAFCVLSYAQLLFSFSCRSLRYTLPELGLLSNRPLLAAIAISGLLQWLAVVPPYAADIFKVERGLGLYWLLIVGLALAPVSIIETGKIMMSAFHEQRGIRA